MPYNPFASTKITGTWEDHASYSAGGTDLPLGYGTPIPAPASGTLQTSGGSGEWATGWVGTAGRRSILRLDTPIQRQSPRRSSPQEGEGPLVAIVLQHQSQFAGQGHHSEGSIIGLSGASASGKDWGGDVHLHWHGLDANGRRLRLESFITGARPATSTPNTAIKNLDNGADMPQVFIWNNKHIFTLSPGAVKHETSNVSAQYIRNVTAADDKYIACNDAQLTALLESFGVPWVAFDAAIKGKAYKIDGSRPGHYWSRELDIQESLKNIQDKLK